MNLGNKKIWFFSDILTEGKEFKAGDEVEMQIMRTGERNHAMYGKVKVDESVIDGVIDNFNDDTRGIDLVVDENHEPNHKALAIFKKLYKKGKNAAFATMKLTKKGAALLSEGAYMYFSPEIVFGPMKDPETGETVKNLLTGGAFTNRPFFKKMSPLMANEDATNEQQGTEKLFLSIIDNGIMNKFNELLEAAKEKTILSFDEKFALKTAFSELDEDKQTEEAEKEVTEQTDKPEVEPKKEGEAEDEGSDTDDEGEDEGKAKAVQASEKSVSSEKYNEMIKRVAFLEASTKKSEVEKEFNENFAFSESNKKGFLNMKHKDNFVGFAMTLNSTQKKAFYEILGNADKTLAAKFKEMGVNHNANSNVATDDGQKYHEAVTKVMADKDIDYSDACDVVNAQQD